MYSFLSLKGDEKWVWDFDYDVGNSDQPIQTIFGFDEPLPVVFSSEHLSMNFSLQGLDSKTKYMRINEIFSGKNGSGYFRPSN